MVLFHNPILFSAATLQVLMGGVHSHMGDMCVCILSYVNWSGFNKFPLLKITLVSY